MRAVKRFLKRLAEKFSDRFYEGPEPPERLAQLVVLFANAHPHATRADWAAFASVHAGEAYKSGFVRGFENAERDDSPLEVEPETIADLLDPKWRDKAYDFRLPDGGILEGGDEEVGEGRSEGETLEEMVRRFSDEGRSRS